MSAILTDQHDTPFEQLTPLGKVKFICKLVIFIATLGYAYPRLLAD